MFDHYSEIDNNDIADTINIDWIPIVISIISATASGIWAAIVKAHYDKKQHELKQQHEQDLASLQHTRNLEYEYDIDLRSKRIKTYKKLWKQMYMLRIYGNPEPIKYIQVRSLGRRLAEWYYEEGGGIFLTEMNQKMYENFVREVDNMVKQKERELNSNVDESELERLKKISSIFRTNLCQSIGTREESRYPSMYSKLQVELEGYHKDDENSYTYYCDDKIIIKIYYPGIELWEANEKIEVWLQVKQLETNKVIMKEQIGLEHTSDLKDLKASWKYKWDQKDLNKKQVDPGVYLGIITSGELSGVVMFKIIEQRKQ